METKMNQEETELRKCWKCWQCYCECELKINVEFGSEPNKCPVEMFDSDREIRPDWEKI
jgi:hypothetical protein